MSRGSVSRTKFNKFNVLNTASFITSTHFMCSRFCGRSKKSILFKIFYNIGLMMLNKVINY